MVRDLAVFCCMLLLAYSGLKKERNNEWTGVDATRIKPMQRLLADRVFLPTAFAARQIRTLSSVVSLTATQQNALDLQADHGSTESLATVPARGTCPSCSGDQRRSPRALWTKWLTAPSQAAEQMCTFSNWSGY